MGRTHRKARICFLWMSCPGREFRNLPGLRVQWGWRLLFHVDAGSRRNGRDFHPGALVVWTEGITQTWQDDRESDDGVPSRSNRTEVDVRSRNEKPGTGYRG